MSILYDIRMVIRKKLIGNRREFEPRNLPCSVVQRVSKKLALFHGVILLQEEVEASARFPMATPHRSIPTLRNI